MNNLLQYMESCRVINAYRKGLYLLTDYSEYQHFLARMSVLDGSKLPEDVFAVKIKELEEIISMTPKEVFEMALQADTNGYMEKLAENTDEDIYNYIYVCRVMDTFGILLRNGQHNVIERFNSFLNTILLPDTVNMMCRISKNEMLRKLEGTLCVNGLGYLLVWIDRWDEYHQRKLLEAFADLFNYYINKVEKHGLANRNYVYGLTHCIIDLSNFYTDCISNQTELFQSVCSINELCDLTRHLIGKNFKNNVKKMRKLNSDMLAELLVVYKLISKSFPSDEFCEYAYYNEIAYQELCRRIDVKRNYIRSRKSKNPAKDLKYNEHTNILFILYSRL